MEFDPNILTDSSSIDERNANLQSQIHAHLLGLKLYCPGHPKILTITVTVTTSIQNITLSAIKDFFDFVSSTDDTAMPNLMIQPIHTSQRTRKPKYRFQNSIPLRFIAEDESKRCIKIFRNGRLHITGVKGGKDLIHILNETSEIIQLGAQSNVEVLRQSSDSFCSNEQQSVDDKSSTSSDVKSQLESLRLSVSTESDKVPRFSINEMKVNMMNLQFYVGVILDLVELKDSIKLESQKNPRISSVEYNSDRCPALILKRIIETTSTDPIGKPVGNNLKHKKKTAISQRVSTLMIYRCGCIKICGLREPLEALDPYVFITTWLENNPDCISSYTL